MKHAHWLLLAAYAAGTAVAQVDKRPDPSNPLASVPAPPIAERKAPEPAGNPSLKVRKPTDHSKH